MLNKIAQALSLVAVLVFASTALAGNGNGPNKSSSLNLVIVSSSTASATSASATQPVYGDTVTFDVSTTATEKPFVQLTCSQNGTMVYSSSAGFFADPWSRNFILSSQSWTGGAADCTATLFYWDGHRFRDLASLPFAVAA